MGEHADIFRTAHRVEDFVCCFVIVHSVPGVGAKKKTKTETLPLAESISILVLPLSQ
jgi:hypothetical protein